MSRLSSAEIADQQLVRSINFVSKSCGIVYNPVRDLVICKTEKPVFETWLPDIFESSSYNAEKATSPLNCISGLALK